MWCLSCTFFCSNLPCRWIFRCGNFNNMRSDLELLISNFKIGLFIQLAFGFMVDDFFSMKFWLEIWKKKELENIELDFCVLFVWVHQLGITNSEQLVNPAGLDFHYDIDRLHSPNRQISFIFLLFFCVYFYYLCLSPKFNFLSVDYETLIPSPWNPWSPIIIIVQ